MDCLIMSRRAKPDYNGGGTMSSFLDNIKTFFRVLQGKNQPQAPVMFVHDDVVTALEELKFDLEQFRNFERSEKSTLKLAQINGVSARKILCRMSYKLDALEESLIRPGLPTCKDLLVKRRGMLDLIKTLQHNIACYLQFEANALMTRQTKLYNLLKFLAKIEIEFRSLTKTIKEDCCPKSYKNGNFRNDSKRKEYNCGVTPANSLNSVHSTATIKRKMNESGDQSDCAGPYGQSKIGSDVPPNRCMNVLSIKNFNKGCQCKMDGSLSKSPCTSIIPNNYAITGLNFVYTKSRLENSADNDEQEPNASEEPSLREEFIDEQVVCRVPVEGEDVDYELQVRTGDNPFRTYDSPEIKDKLHEFKDVWFESARQLLNSLSSCSTSPP